MPKNLIFSVLLKTENKNHNTKAGEMKNFTFRERLLRSSALVIFVLSLVILSAGDSYSQLEEKTIRSDSRQLFYLDPMVFFSKEKSKARLDVYMEIPLENLQFKKNPATKQYDAEILYSVLIKNFAGEVVENESVSDFVSTNKEEQKNLDGSSKFLVREFYLNPGTYDLNVTLSDKNTKKELTLKGKVQVPDFANEKISFSNLMLISNISSEDGKKVITPLVNGNVDNLKEFYVFFEV